MLSQPRRFHPQALRLQSALYQHRAQAAPAIYLQPAPHATQGRACILPQITLCQKSATHSSCKGWKPHISHSAHRHTDFDGSAVTLSRGWQRHARAASEEAAFARLSNTLVAFSLALLIPSKVSSQVASSPCCLCLSSLHFLPTCSMSSLHRLQLPLPISERTCHCRQPS